MNIWKIKVKSFKIKSLKNGKMSNDSSVIPFLVSVWMYQYKKILVWRKSILIQLRFKSRLLGLRFFLSFSVRKFLIKLRRQFRVHNIFRIQALRDLQSFHFVFKITIWKMRNLWSRRSCSMTGCLQACLMN